MTEYVTVAEAAIRAGVSEPTIWRRLRKHPELRVLLALPRRTLVDMAALTAMMQPRKENGQ